MDQIRIGKFISEERKTRGYTQKQLAEKLSISDKTVSKWECGNGFPDVSLILPLCSVLEIDVNELLSGERLPDAEYKSRAENNIVMMINEKDENRKKYLLTTVIGIISTVSFVSLTFIVSFLSGSLSLSTKIILILISLIIFITGLVFAMEGERRIGYYKCRKCGDSFTPSFKAYFLAMHLLSARFMRCPHCREYSWCRKEMSDR